jgi:hypothetical protein
MNNHHNSSTVRDASLGETSLNNIIEEGGIVNPDFLFPSMISVSNHSPAFLASAA